MNLPLDTEGLVLVESLKEDCAKVISTGTGDGLDRGHTLLGDSWRVGTENELGSCAGEFGKTGDIKILVIDRLVCDEI